jgi:hypothetical protein
MPRSVRVRIRGYGLVEVRVRTLSHVYEASRRS